MLRVLVHRLLMSVPLLLVVTALSFVLVSLTPGDAARQILGTEAPPEAYPKLRHELGLDLPLYEQYWRWLRGAVTGDLGTSLFSTEPVADSINSRLPVTLSLMLGALLVSLVVGASLGVASAVWRGALGRAVDGFSLIGFSLPAFWVGVELVVLFAVTLRWFPATGYVPLETSPFEWLRSLTLPVVALSLAGIAAIARQTRESMLDVMRSEYIRVARANGVPPAAIIFRHAAKNAAIPVVTVLGLQAVSLLGGTILVESVFALPGLGGLAVTAALTHDLPVIQGIAVYFTVIVIAVNLVIDIAYTRLNPRIHAE